MLQPSQSYCCDSPFVAGDATSSYIALSDVDCNIHILSADAVSIFVLTSVKKRALALAIEEQTVLVGYDDGEIATLEIQTRTLQPSFPTVHRDPIFSLRLVKLFERYLVSSDYSGLLVLWDLKTATVLHKLTGHTSTVPNMSVFPGEQVLASGSHDGSIRLWDVKTGLQNAAFEIKDRDEHAIEVRGRKFKETVSSMLVLKDGRILAGGVGGFIRVWDTSTASLAESWPAHTEAVLPVLNSISLHPSQSAFVTTGTDGRACLWNTQTFALLRSIKLFEKSVISGTVSWRGSTLLCGGKDGGDVESACGAFNKLIAWNVTNLSPGIGYPEAFEQLGSFVESVSRIWSMESHVVLIVKRRGKLAVEIWTEDI